MCLLVTVCYFSCVRINDDDDDLVATILVIFLHICINISTPKCKHTGHHNGMEDILQGCGDACGSFSTAYYFLLGELPLLPNSHKWRPCSLYPPSERIETGGYTVFSFVCLCVHTQSNLQQCDVSFAEKCMWLVREVGNISIQTIYHWNLRFIGFLAIKSGSRLKWGFRRNVQKCKLYHKKWIYCSTPCSDDVIITAAPLLTCR